MGAKAEVVDGKIRITGGADKDGKPITTTITYDPKTNQYQ